MENSRITIDGMEGTIMAGGDGYGVVRFGNDDKTNVLFYDKPVVDPIKSREMGRRWEVSKQYVRIQHPGEKDYSDRPLTDFDKARFPRQWAQYLQGHKQMPDGTPVDVLFPQSPEIPANLHSLGCHTIEQLAGMTEHGSQTIGMGATQWRDRARKFLEAAAGSAGIHRLEKQIEDERNKNEVLSNQISQLQTQVTQLLAMQQGVPRPMIPQNSPTIAQQTSQQTFANDGPEESDPAFEAPGEPEPYAQSGVSAEPLFVDPNASEASNPAPRRRGRPPGSRNQVN